MKSLGTPMEKIKAYQHIRSFLNEEQQDFVATMLQLTNEDRERRIAGLEAQDEFLLRYYALGKVAEVISFEERASRLTNTPSLDYLLILTNGRRLAVETRSTEKEQWKISVAEMNKKQKIAGLLNGELYFAVKLQDRWGFYPADYVKQQNCKINKNDLRHSENYILGERYFIIQDELKFKEICTPEIKNSLQVEYPNYGYIQRMTIEFKKRPILRVNSSSITKLRYYMFILTYFSDMALCLSPQVQAINDNRILITSILPEETAFTLSSVMLNPIFHILKEPGDVHDLSSYMTDIVDKITNPEDYTYYRMNPQVVLDILHELHEKGVRIQEFRDQGLGVPVIAYDIN